MNPSFMGVWLIRSIAMNPSFMNPQAIDADKLNFAGRPQKCKRCFQKGH